MFNFLFALLPASLIISPGTYEGKECFKEGVYRFYEYPKKMEQRIVYNGDLFKLLESITWVHLHGYKDTPLTDAQKLEIGKTRKISIACGDIARLTKTILTSFGIKSRVVQFITNETPNKWSDGHLMIEIFDKDHWVLVDIDARIIFIHNDHMLSADQFMSLGVDKVKLKKFSDAPLLSYNDLSAQGYNYDFTLSMEEILIRKDPKIYYKRVCQKYYYY